MNIVLSKSYSTRIMSDGLHISHLPYTDSVILDRFKGLRSLEVSIRLLKVIILSQTMKYSVFFSNEMLGETLFQMIEINSLYDLSVCGVNGACVTARSCKD